MRAMSAQFSRSALTLHGVNSLDDTEAWFDECARRNSLDVTMTPLSTLPGWSREAMTGDWVHDSGRFFRVSGIEVHTREGVTRQPIIEQTEIGTLGFLVKQFDGVLHLLVQAKMEPGNQGGLQLAPTVQATRSNANRVHGGLATPYLEHFLNPDPQHVLVDTLQSEQGWWFYQKRNRNLVVWTPREIEVADDFCWMTLGQLFHFLDSRDIMNMDARSVLACLPCFMPGKCALDRGQLERSQAGALSRLSTARAATSMIAHRIPLNRVWNWHDDGERFCATDGHGPFDIIGAHVRARGREVVEWAQPMLRPRYEGRFDLVFRRGAEGIECLLSLDAEPGLTDIVEFGPTERWPKFAPTSRPELGATRTIHDQVQSEEGGRFFSALSRYVVREVIDPAPSPPPEGHAWLSLAMIQRLLTHPRYLTVEARSLVVCLQRTLSRQAERAMPPSIAARPGVLRNSGASHVDPHAVVH